MCVNKAIVSSVLLVFTPLSKQVTNHWKFVKKITLKSFRCRKRQHSVVIGKRERESWSMGTTEKKRYY